MHRQATTRRDGTFEFEVDALGSGRKVVARADGCVPAEGWLPSPRRGFAPIEDLLNVPGTSLRGRLVGGDGQPRAG